MSEKPNDKRDVSVDASLPRTSVKFTIRGRNYNAFRVKLGQRIMLGEFFGEIIKAVIGDEKLTFSEITSDDKLIGLVLGKLPEVFRVVENQYIPIVKDCTDIDIALLELDFELEDLVTVFKNIWEANGFTETMKGFAATANKKKGVNGLGGSKS